MRAERRRNQPAVATARRARPAWRSLPWIAIVTLTAIVQFYRDAPLDGTVFGAVAVALIVDALRILPDVPSLPRPGLLPVLIGAGAVAALLILSPRHGVVDGIVLVGVGVVALPVAWAGLRPAAPRQRGPRPGEAAAVRRTAILWAGVGLATCAWELT